MQDEYKLDIVEDDVGQVITIDDDFFDRYTDPDQQMKAVRLFEMFRTEVYDFMGEKNVLDKQQIENTNAMVNRFFQRAIRDLNSGTPISRYTMFDFPDEGLLIDGAVVFYLIANGLLQLRNQLDYNDSGLSIAMFNKTGLYQSWAQFFLSSYFSAKNEFKRGEIVRSPDNGIVGIASEFGYYQGWGDY